MYAPWICHDESCAFLYSPGNLPAYNRVISCCIGTDGKDAGCIADLIDRVCHCAATETGGQTGHRRRVSETGTVVNIIGFQGYPGELLKEVVLFICASGRRNGSDLII
jgi:hypothetical protein